MLDSIIDSNTFATPISASALSKAATSAFLLLVALRERLRSCSMLRNKSVPLIPFETFAFASSIIALVAFAEVLAPIKLLSGIKASSAFNVVVSATITGSVFTSL